MLDNSKTYILDDQWTDKDALDFMPYVETLADIIQTGNTPLTIGVFGTWWLRQDFTHEDGEE
jgi:hypothetical protein